MVIERFFGSAKRSRMLAYHRYFDMYRIEAHVGMSLLAYILYSRCEWYSAHGKWV